MKRAAPAKMSSGLIVEVQVSSGPSISMVQFGTAIVFPAMPSKELAGWLVGSLVGDSDGVDVGASVGLTVGLEVVGGAVGLAVAGSVTVCFAMGIEVGAGVEMREKRNG
jgi:hypothetical protein